MVNISGRKYNIRKDSQVTFVPRRVQLTLLVINIYDVKISNSGLRINKRYLLYTCFSSETRLSIGRFDAG